MRTFWRPSSVTKNTQLTEFLRTAYNAEGSENQILKWVDPWACAPSTHTPVIVYSFKRLTVPDTELMQLSLTVFSLECVYSTCDVYHQKYLIFCMHAFAMNRDQSQWDPLIELHGDKKVLRTALVFIVPAIKDFFSIWIVLKHFQSPFDNTNSILSFSVIFYYTF